MLLRNPEIATGQFSGNVRKDDGKDNISLSNPNTLEGFLGVTLVLPSSIVCHKLCH